MGEKESKLFIHVEDATNQKGENEMSTKKHTKGPWKLHCYKTRGTISEAGETPWDYASQYISTDGGVVVGQTTMHNGTVGGYPEVSDFDEMIANARLIAEAPAILDMLIEAVEYIDKNVDATNQFADRLEALLGRISGEESHE